MIKTQTTPPRKHRITNTIILSFCLALNGLILLPLNAADLSDNGVDIVGNETDGYTAPYNATNCAKAADITNSIQGNTDLKYTWIAGQDGSPSGCSLGTTLENTDRVTPRAICEAFTIGKENDKLTNDYEWKGGENDDEAGPCKVTLADDSENSDPKTCSAENLTACADQTTCEDAGGAWNNDTCGEKEIVTPPIATCDDGVLIDGACVKDQSTCETHAPTYTWDGSKCIKENIPTKCIGAGNAWDAAKNECVQMPSNETDCLNLANSNKDNFYKWKDDKCVYELDSNLQDDIDDGTIECVENDQGTVVTCYDQDGNIVRVYEKDAETGTIVKEDVYDANNTIVSSRQLVGPPEPLFVPVAPNAALAMIASHMRRPIFIIINGIMIIAVILRPSMKRWNAFIVKNGRK